MMPHYWLALLLFSILCIAVLGLPFLPAWREWRSPSDCEPLPIFRRYANEIDFFAMKFRAEVLTEMTMHPPRPSPSFAYVTDPVENMDWADANNSLIAKASINTVASIRCKPPLFVNADIQAGQSSSFAALLAEGTIQLGPNSEIYQWAHADGAIQLGASSIALGRLSSNTAITLAHGCGFERINAPVVQFGLAESLAPRHAAALPPASALSELPNAKRQSEGLYLINGDCELLPGRLYEGSLIVTGKLLIGSYTILRGDAKSRKGISVGSCAQVSGAIVCEKDIHIAQYAAVAGPVISETDILIQAQATIGASEIPTTISAERIMVESGVTVHGTVWARSAGAVASS